MLLASVVLGILAVLSGPARAQTTSGGATATDGSTASGNANATGGSTASGGATAFGGSTASGCSTATGGSTASGGSCTVTTVGATTTTAATTATTATTAAITTTTAPPGGGLARTGSPVNQTALWAVALAVAGLLLVALGLDGPARDPQSQGTQA